ncbi:hypothetical protein FAI41_00800 [Acetobacteraceae bacterium]|nr:hypothetical protein FAI41_00800 [Acetobacteraceae bacterium]
MKLFCKVFSISLVSAFFASSCSTLMPETKNLPPGAEWQEATPHLIGTSLPDSGNLSFNIQTLAEKSFITAGKPWKGYYAEIDVRKAHSPNGKIQTWVPYSCFFSNLKQPPISEIARYNITPPALSLFYTISPKDYLYNKAYSKSSIWDIFGHARENDSESNDSKHNETTTQAKIAMFPNTIVKGTFGSPKTYLACSAGKIS